MTLVGIDAPTAEGLRGARPASRGAGGSERQRLRLAKSTGGPGGDGAPSKSVRSLNPCVRCGSLCSCPTP